MTSLWCESALVNGQVRAGVGVDIVDGRFASVEVGAEPGASRRLGGFTIPGMANAHSHAFHRALRSRTQTGRGSFWTWHDLMFAAAQRLDPENYHRLARAAFAEMVMAGISCVGEFHYLHHQADGTAYADPNEMGRALFAAAAEAGMRMTLLDTLYLHGGIDAGGYTEPSNEQRRFLDAGTEEWAARVGQLGSGDGQRVGAAIHSVRAVDPTSMAVVASWAAANDAPVHAHVSEQVAENHACLALHGATPVGVFAESGVLSPRFSAVHATHLTTADIDALSLSGSTVVLCPTTERDLGDGIGPSADLASSGVPIAVGSDSHAVVDLFEEARSVELVTRLRSQTRGVHRSVDLLSMATVNGHRSLGWDDAGEIAIGCRADLVTLGFDSTRLAGAGPADSIEAAVFAATAADISDVYIDGRHVVEHGRHAGIDVAAELETTITELMADG